MSTSHFRFATVFHCPIWLSIFCAALVRFVEDVERHDHYGNTSLPPPLCHVVSPGTLPRLSPPCSRRVLPGFVSGDTIHQYRFRHTSLSIEREGWACLGTLRQVPLNDSSRYPASTTLHLNEEELMLQSYTPS